MSHRRGQLDVTHALTANLGLSDFNAALLADHAAVLQALVLTAQALVIFDRPEDTGTEQTITFRLESPVVDGFRLFHFTERPGADHIRGGQTDFDTIKFFGLALGFQKLK